MSRRLRRRLLAERRELVRAIAERLAADADADPAADLERVARLDRALDLLPAGRSWETIARLAVLAGCVLIVATAWNVRLDALGWRTPFVASITTDAVAFDLAGVSPEGSQAGWRLRAPIALPSHADLVIADAVVTLSDPALAAGAEGRRSRLAIRAAELELSGLQVPPEGVMRLVRREPARLEIGLGGAGSAGAVQFGGTGTIAAAPAAQAARGGGNFDLFVPEVARFATDPNAPGVAARLIVPVAEPIALDGFLVSRLSFAATARAAASPDEVFRSAIHGGTVELPQVDERIEVRHGDHLALAGVDATIRRLATTPTEPLTVTITGSADRVVVTSHGFARDVTPTLLVFILRHEPWAFFVGAVTSLSGIVWGLRRWI